MIDDKKLEKIKKALSRSALHKLEAMGVADAKLVDVSAWLSADDRVTIDVRVSVPNDSINAAADEVEEEHEYKPAAKKGKKA